MFRRGKLTFLNTKDDRVRIINERINLTERHLMEMCATFAVCSRKMAKYRDAYDELGHKIKNFADEEKINCSLSDGLGAITNSITIQADYMDLWVHRIEAKIVNEFAQFENLCKTTRESLRNATIARDKEVLKQQQLLEIKSKFSSNNSAADTELLKAKLEVNRSNKEMDDIINNFEKRKLADLKGVLTDFILISIKYHAKALEALSASYYDVSTIDEKGDFIQFQNALKTNSKPEPKERKLALKKGLRSQSMDSLDHSRLLSPLKRHAKVARSNKSLAGKTDDELEDDEEEDEDDDDEDEDEETEDNTNDGENSGAVSENDNTSQALSDGQSTNQADYLKKAKDQVKQPFKATAATHVIRQTKPVTVRSGIGIPALSKCSSTLFSSKEPLKSTGNVAKTIDSANSRMVTVIESKNKLNVHYAETTVIDQTKGVSQAEGNSLLD